MKLILCLLLLFFVWVVWVFNRLVKKRNEVANARAQIEVQLQRRYDLISNLLAVAQAYMQHEQAVFQAVSEARSRALSAPLASDAAKGVADAWQQFLLRVEAYPVLKADEQMLRLQEELRSTENRVAFARQYFNDAVNDYNDALMVFPDHLIAQMAHFRRETLLELPSVV